MLSNTHKTNLQLMLHQNESESAFCQGHAVWERPKRNANVLNRAYRCGEEGGTIIQTVRVKEDGAREKEREREGRERGIERERGLKRLSYVLNSACYRNGKKGGGGGGDFLWTCVCMRVFVHVGVLFSLFFFLSFYLFVFLFCILLSDFSYLILLSFRSVLVLSVFLAFFSFFFRW